MQWIKILLAFVVLHLECNATDLKPWFGNDYEAEIRFNYLYQNYSSISTGRNRHKDQHHFNNHQSFNHRAFKHNANDGFATLSAAYPFKRYCGEFEVTEAHTRHQNNRWDNFRVTGRYQCLSEQSGDRLTLVAGITLTQPYSRALHDISSFHHGHIEGEGHLSIGRKYGYPASNDFVMRWWGIFGMGTSDVGSPWLRGDAAYEYNLWGIHRLRGFVNTLLGTGKKNIKLCGFKGYGSIKHRSVDLGLRYGYDIGCWGIMSFQYARRLFALNFPKNANLFLFEYYYPFGSQVRVNY